MTEEVTQRLASYVAWLPTVGAITVSSVWWADRRQREVEQFENYAER